MAFNMDDDTRTQLLGLLDSIAHLLPSAGGRVKIVDQPDEFHILGDTTGLQRLGVGLLRGTLVSSTSVRGISDAVDIGSYDVFEHHDQVPVVIRQVDGGWPSRERSGFKQQLIDVGCLLVAAVATLLVLLLSGFGVGALLGWFHA